MKYTKSCNQHGGGSVMVWTTETDLYEPGCEVHFTGSVHSEGIPSRLEPCPGATSDLTLI